MTVEPPSALVVEPGLPPRELPLATDEIAPPLGPAGPDAERSAPLDLFLTVDVEDAYFDRPILMSGDGVGREFGVFGILDELDSRSLVGTFFVNVYEKDRQPKGVVESVVREIAVRGHEVGLHTHPSPALEFYRRPLFRLSRSAQVDVLRWGVDLIAEWTGAPPVSFRAGGYALDDDTLAALEAVGIAIDSSCFFPSPNNRNTRRTVNAVSASGGLVEVPITTVLRAGDGGRLAHRKLDLDWLSVDEMTAALAALARYGAGFAMFMMHSFSFIEKRTRRPDQPRSARARFVSEVHFDRYVEVFGPKPAMQGAFTAFLEMVVDDPRLRTRTLRDALPDLRVAASRIEDVVPVVG